MKTRKTIVLLIGESGSGKSWIANLLKKKGLAEALSNTTRFPRKGEIDGVHYNFINREDWNSDELVEETKFGGNFYGLSSSELDKSDEDLVIVVEPKGAQQIVDFVKENRPEMDTFLVYIDIPLEQRIENMVSRGDSEEAIEKRVADDNISERMEESGLIPNITITKVLKKPDSYIINMLDMFKKNMQ